MYGRGSTNIDDLLDLDDPSDGSEGFSNRNVGSYTNAIRSNSYTMKGNAIDGANKIKQQRQVENYQNTNRFQNPYPRESYQPDINYNKHIKERYSPPIYEPYEENKKK